MKRGCLVGTVVAAFAGLLGALSAPAATAQTPELDGQFVLVVADGPHGSTELPYLSRRGTLYRLRGTDARFADRQRVAVDGTIRGRSIDVDAIRPTGAVPARTKAPSSVKALVELVTWTAPDAITPQQAKEQLATTSAAWYDEESYGAMSMTADATSWLTIDEPADTDGDGPATACDNISAIQSEADQAAQAAGHQASDYSRIVYYYPSCPNEQWGGFGEQPGSHTWLIGEISTRTTVHELGHNLGLGHSHSDLCRTAGLVVPYATDCEVDEYGDPTSAMGAGFTGQGMYAAGQQAYLGWLGTSRHVVQDVRVTGSYRLAPLEARAGGTQALRVRDRSGQVFWVEHRDATGNDAFLGTGSTGGVLVRSGFEDSHLYDMTPATAGDFTDAALAPGASWSSPAGGLTVSLRAAAGSVVVDIVTPVPAKPGRPAIQRASSGSTSDHHVSVTGRWKAPTSGGKVARYYVSVVRTSTGGKKTVVVSAKLRSTKITGLRRKAHYRVSVTAANAGGKGQVSKSSNRVQAR